MRKSTITAQQVAKRAGVSQTTVSFVMNNVEGANISEATRERVLQAARELGYVPAAAARSLARGMSNNLGVVLFKPHAQVFTDPFVPNMLSGFNTVAKANGFRLMVEYLRDFEDAATISTMLRGGEVAGILLSGWVWGHNELIHPLIQDGYPIISIDQVLSPDPLMSYITIDHFSGVRTAVEHLIGLGHTRIACISYGPIREHVESRLAVYRATLEAHGIAYNPRWVREGAYDPETGYAAALDLLRHEPSLTAIYGMNDFMALGALQAIRETGRRVPDDIAVIGYDDMRFAAFTAPPLTTVHAPEIEMGARVAEGLIAMLRGETLDRTQSLLETRLVVRGSCGGGREQTAQA